MSVSFNAALNAYQSAANMAKNITPSTDSANHSQAFSGVLQQSLKHTAESLRTAEHVAAKSLVKQADITDVVSAVNSAEMTLQTVIAVRDRLVTAHQEIMKMPI